MSLSERLPPTQWVALKYRGEKFAEVCFQPEGDPLVLAFRIPRTSFHISGMDQQLTMENLLKAVAMAPEEVESWRHGEVTHSDLNGPDSESKRPLPPPPEHVAQLEIYVRLKQSREAVARAECNELEIPTTKWQDLETRWKAIL